MKPFNSVFTPLFTSLIIWLLSTTLFASPTYKQVNNSIPSVLREKLIQYLGDSRAIHNTSATKDGQWFVIGRGVRYWSSTSYFNELKGNGSVSLRSKVNEYMNAGRKIDAVAITNDGNWVVTSGNFRFYSSASKFDRHNLRQTIDRELQRGKTVSQIAIATNDHWVMITNDSVIYSPTIPSDLRLAINDSRVQALKPRLIKFKPNSNEWVFIAGQKVYSSPGLNRSVYEWANKYRNFKWEVGEIFLAPNNGWAVISNQSVTAGNTTEEIVEWKTGNSSIWQRMEHHKANAVSIGYMKDGRISRLRTYGLADVGDHRPAYTDTRFAVASMSKAVGSYSYLHAWQQAIINFDRPLSYYVNRHSNTYLGDWGLSGNRQDFKDGRLNKATYHHLLSHTAGFNKHGIGVTTPPVASLNDVLDGIYDGTEVEFTHNAGIQYDYSGGGFTVAEAILDNEYAGGATKWFNGTIRAMGMTSSTFGSLRTESDTLARLHNTQGQRFAYRECPVKSAGGLFSTPKEYSYFISTLVNGGTTPSGRRLLQPNFNHAMFTPMHYTGSSLQTCQTSGSCPRFDQCVANRCMKPVKSGNNFVGPGIMLTGPFNFRTRKPRIISHGGAQLSTRTKFEYNLERNEGIIVFVSGPREWKNNPNDATEVEKGAGKLLGEVLAAYGSIVGW